MTTRPFPVSTSLSAIAIAYRNPASSLIGRRILPPLPVLSEAFKYQKYTLGEGFTMPELRVARRGKPAQVTFSATEVDNSVADYGLDSSIPISDINEAKVQRDLGLSTIDPEAMATQGIANFIELGREIRVAALVQDASQYPSANKVTLTGSDQLDDDTSDPVDVIETALSSLLVYRGNTVAMGWAVWAVLKKHPKLLKAAKGGLTDEGLINRQQFADIFELKPENILVGESQLNTAKPGQAVALGRVWGKTIWAGYVDTSKQSPMDGIMTFGATAELGTRLAGSIEDKDIGLQGGVRVRAGERVKEFISASDLGYLVSGAIS